MHCNRVQIRGYGKRRKEEESSEPKKKKILAFMAIIAPFHQHSTSHSW